MAVGATPRQGWKPRLSVFGFIGGLLMGASIVVLLQQSGKVYPSLPILIVAVVAGALLGGVVVPSIFRLVAVGRANKAIDRVNSRQAPQAPIAGAVPAPTPAATAAPSSAVAAPTDPTPSAAPSGPAPSAAGAPPSVPAPSSAGAAPSDPAPSAAGAPPASGWVPTHIVPAAGVSAYARPSHKTTPVASVDAGLKVRLINTQRKWAQVEFDNGWTGWVETASLQAL